MAGSGAIRIRPVDELASPEHPAWPQIQGLAEAAPAPPVVAAVRRSAVPLQELFAFYREAAQQLGSGS